MELEEWVCNELESLLGMPEVRDIARKLMSLYATNSQFAAREYADEILGTDREASEFFERFCGKMQHVNFANSKVIAKASEPSKAKGRALHITYVTESKKGQKNRVKCGCFGTEHPGSIICSVCGRIHCGLEGPGNCFFCKSVISRSGTIPDDAFIEERVKIAQRVNANLPNIEEEEKGDQLELLIAQGLEKALAHKNKVLAYANNDSGVKRVIDDQEDFYDFDDVEANVWLDESEREDWERKAEENESVLQNAAYTYRAPLKVTLDFASGTVIQEVNEKSVEATMSQIKEDDNSRRKNLEKAEKKAFVRSNCSLLDGDSQQLYQQVIKAAKEKKLEKTAEKKKDKFEMNQSRVQL